MPEFQAFLSYNRTDSDVARELKERLQHRGLSIFLDTDDIFGGDRWQAALETCAATAPCALILLGRSGLGNWQKAEVELFLAEHRQRQMRVIPVLLPGAPDPTGFLAQHNQIDLRTGLAEEGVRNIEFAILDRRQKFAYKCLVVHPPTEASASWLADVARPVCTQLDVDLQLVGAEFPSIWHGVQQTDFVIADLSEGDPGTVYALGLCHAASRPVIGMTRQFQPPSELRFGGISIIRSGGSVQGDRQALQQAILRLRQDPSAGNALPRVGLFQQLKLIRSTYSGDRRALSLAVRWFREYDQSLTRQIESRRITIEETDFARVRDWLFDYLETGDQILATCFTDMREFYFRKGVGSEYFGLNAAAIRNRRVSMHRIFQVQDDVWRRSDILLRELVDMYLDLDCRISIVRASDVEASPDLRKRDDFLLICDARGQPKAVIDFELDPAGVTSVAFKFSPDELQRKHKYFGTLESAASPHTRARLEPRRTVDQMVANISDLTRAVTNSNTIHYIFDASHSDDDIAAYWSGLRGGLIRPLPGACDTMREMLRRDAASKRLARFDHALVLGSTPEARILARELAHRVTVTDISDVMYHAMSKVLDAEFSVPSAEEHEAFVLGEWSGAVGRGETFDLVLAFDSFNMLHTEDLRRLVKALRSCVKPQGCIVMQWANVPDAAYLETCRSGNPEPTLREAFSTLMRGAVDGASDLGDTLPDHHEMFARLALSQFRASDRRLLLRPVIDFLTNSIVALDPQAENLALKMQKTYALCNTTLFFHSHLQEGVGLKQLDVQRVNANNDRWASLFCVGKFVFQEDATDAATAVSPNR